MQTRPLDKDGRFPDVSSLSGHGNVKEKKRVGFDMFPTNGREKDTQFDMT